jgi:alpha-L-glutamate ligase-like protein
MGLISGLTTPWALNRKGILGINARNQRYIATFNRRCFFPRADDKILTKQLAKTAGIAVPELYAVIKSIGQLRDLVDYISPYREFVVKPAHGSGGEGVYVIINSKDGLYERANSDHVDIDDLQHHISNILHGLYSLGGQPDYAIIEYRVQSDPIFENVAYRGVPDIRIIVFRGVPVLGMVRLPTKMSHGRANLHQGAIGAGIDMLSGKTTSGVWRNKPLNMHPDTGFPITNLMIPMWRELLTMAASCYEFSELGYLGVDIVLDRNLGPLVLEINARPGLSVQIANQLGLTKRLEAVERGLSDGMSVAERVDFAEGIFNIVLS